MNNQLFRRWYSSLQVWFQRRKHKRILHLALKAILEMRPKWNKSTTPPPSSNAHQASHLPLEREALLLHEAIEQKDDTKASHRAFRAAELLHALPRKSLPKMALELIIALVFALALAGLIRQVWFELYEIPTGSMRPTFKEQDRVLVSKSAFGINLPFATNHIAFSPDRIKRGTISVITGDNLDIPDVDTVYFGLFPGKRRYVKRVVALPGDWVYFYGGDIFCLEKDGIHLHHLKAASELSGLEYVPFIHFEGKMELMRGSRFGRQRTVEIKQMNMPICRVEYASNGSIESYVKSLKPGAPWVHQFSESADLIRSTPQTIGDFWGIKNFAKAKLLLPEELPPLASKLGYYDPKALAWLELSHSPTLPEMSPKEALHHPYTPPVITVRTWIPLHEDHCDRLMNGLYTARFVVENGLIHRYHYEGAFKEAVVSPPKPLKDGTYEFYHGKAYEISSWGTATELDEKTSPLYPKTIKELIFWYNIGIDMNENVFSRASSAPMPSRFVYFNRGDLITMGTKIMDRTDPILRQFEENEINRQAKDFAYFSFQDPGSPGDEQDMSFFQAYGLKIPEGHYLLLGDNHAMSVDSRYFGVVPEENIQGSPVFIFWPTGSRWGTPLQPISGIGISPYSALICCIVAGGILWAFAIQKRRYKTLIEELKVSHQPDLEK